MGNYLPPTLLVAEVNLALSPFRLTTLAFINLSFRAFL